MRNANLISIAFLLYATVSFSQKNEAVSVLLKKANEVLYDDPKQSSKIGEYLLHDTSTNLEKTQTHVLLTKSSLVRGNYSESISNIQSAMANAKLTSDHEIQVETFLLAAEIYKYLDLFEISKQYRKEAQGYAEGNPAVEQNLKAYDLFVGDSTPDLNSAVRFVKEIPTGKPERYSFLTKGTALQLTARGFLKSSQMDSAAAYFQKSENQKIHGNYWKMLLLLDYSDFFFAKKDPQRSIYMLEEALEKAAAIGNPFFIMLANEKLSNAYLALGNKTKFEQYRQKANNAGSEHDTQLTLATNFAFETLQQQKEARLMEAKAFRQQSYTFLGILFLLALLAWIFLKWMFATKIRHALDIINYLKLIRKTEEKPELMTKPASKNLSIPKPTEDLLLAKLDKFETGKKYLSKDISLAQMASQFETNTKYLSEIINKYKGKNINVYINELRIRYIVEKLRNEPKYRNYKVSYLAEECGFSSHSSFSAVFKSVTGITPHIFIQFLANDLHEINKPKMAEL